MPKEEINDSSDPDWELILDAFYEEGLEVGNDEEDEDMQRLIERTEIERTKLVSRISYLREVGLLTELPGNARCRLTTDGFQVAHERAQKDREQTTNRRLIQLTVVLGLAAILQALAAAFQLDNQLLAIVLGTCAALLAIAAWVVIRESDQYHS